MTRTCVRVSNIPSLLPSFLPIQTHRRLADMHLPCRHAHPKPCTLQPALHLPCPAPALHLASNPKPTPMCTQATRGIRTSHGCTPAGGTLYPLPIPLPPSPTPTPTPTPTPLPLATPTLQPYKVLPPLPLPLPLARCPTPTPTQLPHRQLRMRLHRVRGPALTLSPTLDLALALTLTLTPEVHLRRQVPPPVPYISPICYIPPISPRSLLHISAARAASSPPTVRRRFRRCLRRHPLHRPRRCRTP